MDKIETLADWDVLFIQEIVRADGNQQWMKNHDSAGPVYLWNSVAWYDSCIVINVKAKQKINVTDIRSAPDHIIAKGQLNNKPMLLICTHLPTSWQRELQHNDAWDLLRKHCGERMAEHLTTAAILCMGDDKLG